MTRFWLGGYGSTMEGSADGIGLLAGDEGREASTLAYRGAVTETPSPSWLAQHPSLDVVYAALEGDAAVQAFARTGDASLSPLGSPMPVGESVCHLAVAPNGSALVASCYGDGRVVRVGLDAAGRMVPQKTDAAAALRAALFGEDDPDAAAATPAGVGVAASDPHAAGPDRASHAHSAAFLPDGRIVTTDLGFDLVRFWRQTSNGLALDHEVVLPLGTGPRHMVVHPSGHLHVVTEYSCEVFTLASAADGTWSVVSSTMASPIAQVGTDFPAELARSRDGQFLYTALRGSNTIAALRVRGGGEALESVALADAGVDWPRHHLIHEGKMLVAGQRSDTITLLDLDERTGAPLGIRHEAQVPTPTHFLLVR
ncbi:MULTISPECIES: beta-propeller fold lactonase family protein [unclassified Microbacterium]|uniref:lactonase family protein n=1 Tax=unclassified Microbacterium TaxID=2609290 RepID=UPI000EA85F54|nr:MULTISPECIES: beta-propeller fold lactonase family protein [unclassified Microbacterium]MBT2484152.1 beta-propeller fold lactonase family protein [Microbacterium sp. ISL-108]RKN67094.1 3-carboxymuconate cyclase [Microbacterium sp. CGR2]